MVKALYRKYRPKTLSEVVGQDSVVKTLSSSLKNNKISHAYLFTGPRGTGKTSIARIFAHEINNFPYELEDNYIDIIEIDAASNTGVDNIRELREKATIAPVKGKYKIYIIDEVHMLSKSAFNALLKTLEEPPEHVIFIMATTDADKVPVTITSRAQVFTFQLADKSTMFDFLKKISEKEKIKIDDDALKIVVKRGGGSFRDSLSLLDQISTLTSEKITAEIINNALGLPAEEKITDLFEAYKNKDLNLITKNLKNLLSSGLKTEAIVEFSIEKIIDDPSGELLPLLSSLTKVTSPFSEAKLLLAFVSDLPQTPAQEKIVEKPAKKEQKLAKEPIVEPEKPEKPNVAQSAPEPQPTPTNFSWENFLNNIRSESALLVKQLEKTTQTFEDRTLHIYPATKGVKILLERETNLKIFAKYLPEIELIIHSPDEPKKDQTISKISDIMGNIQEVKTNGGEIPF